MDHHYSRLRQLNYPFMSLFVLVYSCMDPSSFEHIVTYWIPEILERCSSASFILVSQKTDLNTVQHAQQLSQHNLYPVLTSEGLALAKACSAITFVEISAMNMETTKITNAILNTVVCGSVRINEYPQRENKYQIMMKKVNENASTLDPTILSIIQNCLSIASREFEQDKQYRLQTLRENANFDIYEEYLVDQSLSLDEYTSKYLRKPQSDFVDCIFEQFLKTGS
jgi:GTPase SAR1 family protein